jgi:hypothetical protein
LAIPVIFTSWGKQGVTTDLKINEEIGKYVGDRFAIKF